MSKIAFIGDIHGKNSTPLGRLCDYNEDLFKKLEWIRDYCIQNKIDTVVHLGDIYDKPEATDEWKNKFIQVWRQYNGRLCTIIGKLHDLFHNNENSYSKTCLYNLELSGVLQVLREPLELNDVVLYPLSMHTVEAKEEIKYLDKKFNKSCDYILLAHQFYNWELDLGAGFTEEELLTLQTKCSLILGHDHRQHETEEVGMCKVFRPGSLMRTELSETIINQRPRILVYDSGNLEYVEVPHKDINEIYNVSEYRLSKTNTKAFRQIENNIENVSKYLHNEDIDIISCSQALKDLECPKEEFEYLKYVHQLCGQAF